MTIDSLEFLDYKIKKLVKDQSKTNIFKDNIGAIYIYNLCITHVSIEMGRILIESSSAIQFVN